MPECGNTLNKRSVSFPACELIILGICLLPRLILAWMAVPLRTVGDEFSTLFFAGILAGKKWLDLISNVSYYGFGMDLFTWWILKLPIGPVSKYRMMLSCCALMQSMVGLICCRILQEYRPEMHKGQKILISVACCFMVVTRNTIYYNENALILLAWVLAWLIFELVRNEDDSRARKKYTLLLSLALPFSLLFHTRSLTFLLAFIFLYLCGWIFYRRSLVDLKIFVPINLGWLALALLFVKLYQKVYWPGAESITNAFLPDVTGHAYTLRGMLTAGLIVFSQIMTISVVSGGVVFFGAAFLLITGLRHFGGNYRLKGEEKAFFMAAFFCLTCMLATSLFQALSWWPGVDAALYGEGDLYPFKAFTYIRYFGPYTGMVFLAGLLAILDRSNKKLKYVVLAVFVLCAGLWAQRTVPLFQQSGNCGEAFICFIQGQPNMTGAEQYYAGVKAALLLILMVFLLRSGRTAKVGVPLILCAFLIYQYAYNAYNYDIALEKNVATRVDSSWELLNALENEGIDLGEKLYFADERNVTDHYTYLIFQFYMQDYTVVPDYPPAGTENNILITNVLKRTKNHMDTSGYATYMLDYNEALVTNAPGVIAYMEAHASEYPKKDTQN